jgi:hypothetical protein
VTPVRRWVAVAVVLPVLAAGCSDDPEPRFEPSPSPTESTSSAAPEPKAWEVKSEAGAYAFVRHWVATLNDAGRTGDTDELSALSAKPCGTCRNIIGYIDDVYGEGGEVRSDGWRIVNLGELPENFDGKRASVPARIRESRQVVLRRNPNKRVVVEPSTFTMTFDVVWDGGWSVKDAVIVT